MMTAPTATSEATPEVEKPDDNAQEFAMKAIRRIKDEGIPPIPENFAIWYHYYSNRNPDLSKAIDVIAARKLPFDTRRCRALYDDYINQARAKESVRSISAQVDSMLTEMIAVFDAAGLSSRQFGSALTAAASNLATATTVEGFRELVVNLARETQKMLVENRQLQGQLRETNTRMEALKNDLQAIRTETRMDALTGVANRRAFDEGLRGAMAVALETATPLALLMIDIDFFKRFNDTHGHQTGDLVLKLVARTLQNNIRDTDTAARYGGEEFGVILPDTPLAGAQIVAAKLNKIMAEKRLLNRKNGEDLGSVTISVGVSMYQSGETADLLIDRADRALYEAKRGGRNRVVICDENGRFIPA